MRATEFLVSCYFMLIKDEIAKKTLERFCPSFESKKRVLNQRAASPCAESMSAHDKAAHHGDALL